MGRKHSSTSAARVGRSSRAGRALELRKAGLTFRTIGQKMGFSEQRAHTLVTEELARLNATRAEAAEAVTRLEVERLDALWVVVYRKAVGGDMAAVDRCIAIMGRRAKMLGIDKEKGGFGGVVMQNVNTAATVPITPQERADTVRAILVAASRTDGENSEAKRLLEMVEEHDDVTSRHGNESRSPGEHDDGHAGRLPYGLREWEPDDDPDGSDHDIKPLFGG
jgi:hypothetical protein